jgi:hypothetical protein
MSQYQVTLQLTFIDTLTFALIPSVWFWQLQEGMRNDIDGVYIDHNKSIK